MVNITATKLAVEVRKIDKPLDEHEDAVVGFLHVDKTSLLASSQLLFQLKFIELIQPNQHLPWGWRRITTIILVYPDFGEFLFLLGEERCGNDSLEGSRLVEGLASTQSAPNPAVGQALDQLKLHVRSKWQCSIAYHVAYISQVLLEIDQAHSSFAKPGNCQLESYRVKFG